MLPRDNTSLLDIIEQIEVIREHLVGISYEDFMSDVLRAENSTTSSDSSAD